MVWKYEREEKNSKNFYLAAIKMLSSVTMINNITTSFLDMNLMSLICVLISMVTLQKQFVIWLGSSDEVMQI